MMLCKCPYCGKDNGRSKVHHQLTHYEYDCTHCGRTVKHHTDIPYLDRVSRQKSVMNDAGPFSKKASDEIDRRRKEHDPAQIESDERAGYHFIHGHFPEDKTTYSEIGIIYNLDASFNVQCTTDQEQEPTAHTIQYNQVKDEQFRRLLFDGEELVTDKGEPVHEYMYSNLQHLRQMIENGDVMLDEAFNEEDADSCDHLNYEQVGMSGSTPIIRCNKCGVETADFGGGIDQPEEDCKKPEQPTSKILCDSCARRESDCIVNTAYYRITDCIRYREDPTGGQIAELPPSKGRIILSSPESCDDPTYRQYVDDHPKQSEDKEIPIASMWLALWFISVAAIGTVVLAGWKLVDVIGVIMKGLAK